VPGGYDWGGRARATGETALTIRLHDLCGADDLRFSPYCARVKMALALKGLAYETVPVPFSGIAAAAGGISKTVPIIEDGGKTVADSFAIAEYLDEAYPDRPLFAPGPAGRAAARFVEGAMVMNVQAAAMPLVALSIHDRIQPQDRAYFRESREKRLGRSLEAAFADHETRLPEFRKVFHPLRQVLAHTPFLGGDAPLFSDCIAYGSLHWLHAVSDLDWFAGDAALSGWFGRCRVIAAGGAPR
jgi:glutathione S-transferase